MRAFLKTQHSMEELYSYRNQKRPEAADVNVSAQGDRRTLEALYLELCELAKQNGLEIEWRLTRNKPDDRADF
jgi:hypothetical protein